MTNREEAGGGRVLNPGFDYEVFGLRVRSDVELPELPPARGTAPADVNIRSGRIPPLGVEYTARFNITEAGALLNVPQAGRFLISNGNDILVEPDPEGSERNLRLYLLGSAFGALLHQRSLLPLHANAMEMNGKAVAFLGHSGAGKSTMAAWFNDRGYNVLSDDVCVVSSRGDAPLLAYPGIPRLRLWREALEASGRNAADYEFAFDNMDKYTVPTPINEDRRPLELAAVYLLNNEAGGDGMLAVSQLTGIAAVDAVIANTYRGAYVPLLGKSKAHLDAAMTVVRNVPIFEVRRQWGREHFDRQLRLIEEHALAITASG